MCSSPTTNGGMQTGIKLSWNTCAHCMHVFARLGADLHAQRVLVGKIAASELSQKKFVKSELLVGRAIAKPVNLCFFFPPFPVQLPGVKEPYAFSYTILDENTGLTHSREEEGDEHGVVVGSYEVLEPDCHLRRVRYRADREHGFDVLGVERRPCDEQQRRALAEAQEAAPAKDYGQKDKKKKWRKPLQGMRGCSKLPVTTTVGKLCKVNFFDLDHHPLLFQERRPGTSTRRAAFTATHPHMSTWLRISMGVMGSSPPLVQVSKVSSSSSSSSSSIPAARR